MPPYVDGFLEPIPLHVFLREAFCFQREEGLLLPRSPCLLCGMSPSGPNKMSTNPSSSGLSIETVASGWYVYKAVGAPNVETPFRQLGSNLCEKCSLFKPFNENAKGSTTETTCSPSLRMPLMRFLEITSPALLGSLCMQGNREMLGLFLQLQESALTYMARYTAVVAQWNQNEGFQHIFGASLATHTIDRLSSPNPPTSRAPWMLFPNYKAKAAATGEKRERSWENTTTGQGDAPVSLTKLLLNGYASVMSAQGSSNSASSTYFLSEHILSKKRQSAPKDGCSVQSALQSKLRSLEEIGEPLQTMLHTYFPRAPKYLVYAAKLLLAQLFFADIQGARYSSFHSAYKNESVVDSQLSPKHVISYVRALMRKVAYLPLADPTTKRKRGKRRGSSSSRSSSMFWGTNENETALLLCIERWLSHGGCISSPLHTRERACPTHSNRTVLHHSYYHRTEYKPCDFLDGVELGKVPWLKAHVGEELEEQRLSFNYSKDKKKYSSHLLKSATPFISFFIIEIVVPLLKVSVHFTPSLKTVRGGAVLMYPLDIWKRISMGEAQSLCGGENSKPLATPKDLWKKRDAILAVVAKKRVMTTSEMKKLPTVIFGSVRLLPDGRKLRPITTVKVATAARLVAQIKANRRGGRPFRWRPKTAHSASSHASHSRPLLPNRGILREALQCFHATAGSSHEGTSRSMSHEVEYKDWVTFVESCRSKSSAEGSSTMLSHFIRADATRCYDSLPQTLVKEAIAERLSHDHYYSAELVGVFEGGHLREKGGRTTVRKDWSTIIAGDEALISGRLKGIPRGWVVEEPRTKHTNKRSFYTGSSLTAQSVFSALSRHPQHSVNSPIIFPSNKDMFPHVFVYDGNILREALLQHTQRHIVSMTTAGSTTGQGGGSSRAFHIHKQSRGISQGSSVALALCDRVYNSTVDRAIVDSLNNEMEDTLSMKVIFLRRVDDVIIGVSSSTEPSKVKSLYEDVVRKGWPQYGFKCVPEKTRCTVGEDLPVSPVPWCGLMICPVTLEIFPSWNKTLSLLCPKDGYAAYSFSPMFKGNGWELIISTYRILAIIQVRLPITVLCHRINRKERVLQTVCEAAMVWAIHFIHRTFLLHDCGTKHKTTSSTTFRPHIAYVLLRPLAVVKSFFVGHICDVRRRELKKKGSDCPLSKRDVIWCIVAALEATFQHFSDQAFKRARGQDKQRRLAGKKCQSRVRFLAFVEIVIKRKVSEATEALLSEPGNSDPAELEAVLKGSLSNAATQLFKSIQ